MNLTPSSILQYLQRRRISVWSVAMHLDTDPGHLRRVLTGRREGSQALLRAVLEAAMTMQGRPRRRHQDIDRLLHAATHMFFLKRGNFESAIFADPNEMGQYRPGPRKGRAHPSSKKGGQCPP